MNNGKEKVHSKTKRVAKKYWNILQEYLELHYKFIRQIEAKMQMESGIEDLEFLACDNVFVGVGNIGKEYTLLQDEELK